MAVYVLNASKRLTDLADALRAGALDAIREAAQAVQLADGSIDIVVRSAPHLVVPGWGIGGFCADTHTIFLYVDPACDEIEAVIGDRLKATVAHEVHHIARRRGPGYGETLLEALVSEGLADHFARAVAGCSPPHPGWADAGIPQALRERAIANYDLAYDHRLWFHGSNPGEVPPAAGYVIGFEIVGTYLSTHTNQSAASLAGCGAEPFRDRATS